ncbi:MAG: redoxin domain-containing protein [Xanthomonadales bacterium]|jgi:peroxiredoxin|nr:redoxin domain-containing protein [Xanthomonadales bacterium]
MQSKLRPAPEISVQQWFNTKTPLSLAQLRGKVVVIEAFQMLCPGCVSHGLPQATRVYETFPQQQVQVIGLHTVFEHHSAMTPTALEAFLHEYRIRFPVGVDTPGAHSAIPETMGRYQLRGTPSIILIDQQGRLRKQHFGMEQDLRLGAEIMTLLNEASMPGLAEHNAQSVSTSQNCDEQGCAI